MASAPGASTAPVPSRAPAAPVAPAPGLEVVPLVLVHGIGGSTKDFGPLCDRLEQGRTVVREMYVDEADALAANSLAPDSVFAVGYYRSRIGGPDFDPHASIGGCPTPRTDGLDSWYTISYADRLRRCVVGIKRATGAARVDLVCHSMGGLVGRAYARWLSLDPSGASSVRRILLVASPSRGINALECVSLAVAHSGNVEFMRQGECLELCAESDVWGGQSFVTRLNDGWDAFCLAKGIRYAGLSATGPRGLPGGASGSVIPASGIPLGPVQQFLSGLSTASGLGSVWPLVGQALADLPRQVMDALGPSDGIVRLASSRLDGAPFLDAAFWAPFEGAHTNAVSAEQVGHGSTYAAECVRAFLVEGRDPGTARCERLELAPVSAPGRATWIEVDVRVSGPGAERSPLALQLVESVLDASGAVVSATAYGAALRAGDERLGFFVPAGGGARTYRAVVYGEHGPIGMAEATFTLQDGAVEAAPVATVHATVQGDRARLDLGSNEPGAEFSVRFDRGPWLPWTASATWDSPPLLPGLHRVEVRARHGGNATGVTVECATPAAISIRAP